MKRRANDAKIARELDDLDRALLLLPDNPINWVNVIRLVAPILARLGARYALKKAVRSLAEDKVNTIGKAVGDHIAAILEKRLPQDGGS